MRIIAFRQPVLSLIFVQSLKVAFVADRIPSSPDWNLNNELKLKVRDVSPHVSNTPVVRRYVS